MQQSLRELLEKYLSESLSSEEQTLFRKMLEEKGYEGELELLVEEYINDRQLVGEEDDVLKKKSFARLENEMHRMAAKTDTGSVIKMKWFRKAGWAAAVILLAGAGTWFWYQEKEKNGTKTASLPADKAVPVAAAGIAPGGNKAILTLADGTKILLDSASNGTLASQGKTQILKTGNGELVYEGNGRSRENMINTISTPAGGQYQVVLPDGTKARLNAGSSITFPAAFNDRSREVSITGEVFLDVARNARQPFVVKANNTDITVLGTSFNINAYKEEPLIRTTLLEGSVMVNAGGRPLTLKPGQQAAVSAGKSTVTLVEHPDMDKVLAWTNGLFNFEGSGLQEVMRQLEHWYDITVAYEGKLPAITFKGKMYRNVNLADVLEMLQEMGFQFKLEGKRLVVSGKDDQ